MCSSTVCLATPFSSAVRTDRAAAATMSSLSVGTRGSSLARRRRERGFSTHMLLRRSQCAGQRHQQHSPSHGWRKRVCRQHASNCVLSTPLSSSCALRAVSSTRAPRQHKLVPGISEAARSLSHLARGAATQRSARCIAEPKATAVDYSKRVLIPPPPRAHSTAKPWAADKPPPAPPARRRRSRPARPAASTGSGSHGSSSGASRGREGLWIVAVVGARGFAAGLDDGSW